MRKELLIILICFFTIIPSLAQVRQKEVKDSLNITADSLYQNESNPFKPQTDVVDIVTYPKLYLGTGIGFNNLTFKNIKNAFSLLESQLDKEGYSFTHHFTDNFSVRSLYYFFFKISLDKNLDLTFEISNSFSDITFRSTLISLIYNYRFLKKTPIYILAGAGWGGYYFKFKKDYGLPLNTGGILKSINAEGEKNSICIITGIKYEFSKSIDIDLLGNYSFVPQMQTTIETGDVISVDLKNLSSSLRLSFGF